MVGRWAGTGCRSHRIKLIADDDRGVSTGKLYSLRRILLRAAERSGMPPAGGGRNGPAQDSRAARRAHAGRAAAYE